jgi:kinetochore protein Spc24
LTAGLGLTKVYEAARISSTRPASVPSQQAHVSLLNELENSKLSLAKAISDAESLAGNKDAELSGLRDEARRLEGYDPAVEHTKELDGSVLRLQLIKGLGFEPILDTQRGVGQMLVRESCFWFCILYSAEER